MGEKKDDYHDLLDQKRLLGEIEQGVRLANREIIQAAIPDLTKDAIFALAEVVGRLRALSEIRLQPRRQRGRGGPQFGGYRGSPQAPGKLRRSPRRL